MFRAIVAIAAVVWGGAGILAQAPAGGGQPAKARPAPSDAAPGDFVPQNSDATSPSDRPAAKADAPSTTGDEASAARAGAGPPEALPTPAADSDPTRGAGDAAPAAGNAPANAKGPSADGPDKWRYRWHEGLWWYWLPENRWVYWHDGKWVSYEPRAYAEFNRTRSYSPSDQQSRIWGPMRYNGYGQPEYPYSRRTRGIRQLGPVPAMGGVRSLPGWGGER
jgi:hypothetical protein